MEFRPCYYGSVNRWECDENDHLNVRFYAEKINQATGIFLREVVGDRPWTIRSQHLRFVREARIATPLRVECAPLSVTPDACLVLALMRNNLTDEPIAAFSTGCALDTRGERWPVVVKAPDWAAPKGLDPDDPYPAQTDLAAAHRAGFRTMGRGVIGSGDCDGQGHLLAHHYIGRISDGMPNLWAFMSDAQATELRRNGALGGAALEYRLELFSGLRAGDVFRQVSGIRALGNKTQHMVHMIFNETEPSLVARAEAVGVAMDLQTRRAVPISDARRAQMQTLMLA